MEKNVFTKKKTKKLAREMGLVDSSSSSQGEKRNESLMIIYKTKKIVPW